METLEVEVELDEPTFWGAVGWPGIALYGLALAVAGIHVYIAAEYTFYFRDMQVEGVWVFLLLAGLFVLTLVAHGCRWKNLAKTAVRKEKENHSKVCSSWRCGGKLPVQGRGTAGKCISWKLSSRATKSSTPSLYTLAPCHP